MFSSISGSAIISISGSIPDTKVTVATTLTLSRNFFTENPKEYLENLFKNEEVHERTSLIIEHRNFLQNILGGYYKFFYDDWKKDTHSKKYPKKRTEPLFFYHKKNPKAFPLT